MVGGRVFVRIEDLAGTTIGAAVSGGLDSCTITRWLVEEGVGVVALTADVGQPDEDDINDVAERMRVAGAQEALIVDAREALARAGLEVIQAQAKYEGGYWNTTGIARYATVAAILPELTSRGLTVLSTGPRGAATTRFGSSWRRTCWHRACRYTRHGATRVSWSSSPDGSK